MPIIPCSDELMGQAESLVRSSFRWMTPIERLSFIAIKHPASAAGRLLMHLAGLKDKVASDEAVWVAWFCVDPKARGRGIGQALIAYTVSLARNAGFNRIRLYTSTDSSEAAALRLYERNGFKEIGRKKGMFATTI